MVLFGLEVCVLAGAAVLILVRHYIVWVGCSIVGTFTRVF